MREIKKQEKHSSKKQKTEENNFPQFAIHHFILIFTSCFCLGLYPNRAITATPNLVPTQPTILNPGMMGADVQLLQVQLKALGYYNGVIDGQYGISTQNSVAQFQKAKSAERKDGIADLTTQGFLNTALSAQTKCPTVPAPTPQVNTKSQPSKGSFIWWSLLGLGILGSVGAVFYFIKRSAKVQYSIISEDHKLLSSSESDNQKLLSSSNHNNPQFLLNPVVTTTLPSSTELVHSETSPIFSQKTNVFDELIQDLNVNDIALRRKAIWNLGQQGDSRAIKPLVDLMIDADSQQHGLILSALAEIGSRTLKPMNRALAISMHNESPQVRKNAIRDLVRIYDMMGQMSQVLRHALEDPDPDVQATARYAFAKMNRITNIPEQQILTDMNAEDNN